MSEDPSIPTTASSYSAASESTVEQKPDATPGPLTTTAQNRQTEQKAAHEPTTPAAEDTAPATGEDTSKLQRALESERKARKEADQRAKTAGDEATARAEQAEAKQSEFLDGLAKLLGVKSEDTPPDPGELQQTVAARDSELSEARARIDAVTAEKDAQLRERDVELAAWRAAAKQGANLTVLMDSRAFLGDITRLDFAAESFANDLDAAVKARLIENPTLRALPPVVDPGEAGIGASGSKTVVTTPGSGTLQHAYGGS